MTAAKITISLPEKTLARARAAVRARDAPSLSAFIVAAIEQTADRNDLRRMLDEIFAESGGKPKASERATARRDLGLPSRRTRRP